MEQALGKIQEQLWRLITEPDGVEAALAAAGDPHGAALAALVRADRGPGPADRVEVYARAYFARIHDCLRDDFPALACALGPAAFHDLVKTYLMMHPPAQPSLRHAGAHLAEHLSAQPFAEIFSRRCPYAAELARLEWAMAEAFYAADSPVLARENLESVAPEDWSGVRLEWVRSLQLLVCAWPVHRARQRFDRQHAQPAWNEAPRLVAEPTYLRVWRHEEQVRYQRISWLEVEALGAARAGESFGAICERVASAAGEADAAAVAAAFLASWVSGGLLAGQLGDGPSVRRVRLPSSTRRAAGMS